MNHRHSLLDLLHRATHRTPGIPAHTDRPPGHQGRPRHGHSRTHHHSPPRVLKTWQNRIARLFGQDPA